MKRLGYCRTYYETNTGMLVELKFTTLIEKIHVNKSNWTNHVNRGPHNRLPRIFKTNK